MDLVLFVNMFSVAIILVALFNFNLAVGLYVGHLILVPGLQINLGSITLSYNFVNIVLLVVFIWRFYRKNKSLRLDVIYSFLFLYFSLLVLSVFTDQTPLGWSFDYWRGSIMQVCILPLIIWNNAKTDRKSLLYIKWSLIISVFIACIYGLILTRMHGYNPYASTLSDYFGKSDAAQFFQSETVSRIEFSTAGKIQATMEHPMTWAIILCFTMVIVSVFYYRNRRNIYLVFSGLIAANIFVSGVRTAIAALVITLIYFLIRYRKIKIILLVVCLVFLVSVVIDSKSDVVNIFRSFVDLSGLENDMGGSSISMRMEQFMGVSNEIEGREIFGNGFGWTSYYQFMYGEHPILLSFESLLFIVLCNNGYMGVLVWLLFGFLLFRFHRKTLNNKFEIYATDALVVVYLSYALGTGEYDYMKYFTVFYCFLVAYFTFKSDRELNSIK